MNKNFRSESRSSGEKRNRLSQTTSLLPLLEEHESEAFMFCVACLLSGVTVPAVGHTSHPEYRRLALCAQCIAHYDRANVE